MCAQFQRNHTCLVTLVSGHVSAAQTTSSGGKKMKAGGSQLPAAVFVFICNLFFVPRHQSTDIQVRVRFGCFISTHIPVLRNAVLEY